MMMMMMMMMRMISRSQVTVYDDAEVAGRVDDLD